MVDACDEHIKEKKQDLAVINSTIEERNAILSKLQSNTVAKRKAYKVQQTKYENFLKNTSSSLKNVSDAIREATESFDADAMEQTILLMTSFSVTDFKGEIEQLNSTSRHIREELESAKSEEEQEEQSIRALIDEGETLLKHIDEIESIQKQLEKEIVGDDKSHAD